MQIFKACLAGLLCVPFVLLGAGCQQIKADSTAGCPVGQSWDVVVAGCTAPLKLRSEPISAGSPDCSCGEGKTGSCTALQKGSYDVFGWRLTTDGREQISSHGPVNWESVQILTTSCKAEVK